MIEAEFFMEDFSLSIKNKIESYQKAYELRKKINICQWKNEWEKTNPQICRPV